MEIKKNLRVVFILLLFFIGIASCSSENPLVIEDAKIETDSISERSDSISDKKDCIVEHKQDSNKEDTLFVDTILFAHWNIGNFSNGKSFSTTITPDDYIKKKNEYISFLDSINADILCLCEYNPQFSTNDSLAREAILSNYQFASIGMKLIYNCNAIFSKDIAFTNDGSVFFKQRVQNRYYRIANIRINGETVKIIVSHLDWNQGENGAEYRKSQIQELVESFSNDKYVIISADFNISDMIELEPFKKAGFILSSDKEKEIYYTAPSTNPSSATDNIIVKGFDIQQTKIYQNSNLSDHCAISSKLAFKHY